MGELQRKSHLNGKPCDGTGHFLYYHRSKNIRESIHYNISDDIDDEMGLYEIFKKTANTNFGNEGIYQLHPYYFITRFHYRFYDHQVEALRPDFRTFMIIARTPYEAILYLKCMTAEREQLVVEVNGTHLNLRCMMLPLTSLDFSLQFNDQKEFNRYAESLYIIVSIFNNLEDMESFKFDKVEGDEDGQEEETDKEEKKEKKS